MDSNVILLVQPRKDTGPLLRARLEEKGYIVVEVNDTATALNVVNDASIGLVVTELYLRVGKSRCLARVIGESPSLQRTRLLAYTRHGKRADRDWARQIGADGYVITRSGEERFLSVVDHLMETPSMSRRSQPRLRRVRSTDGDGPRDD